MIKIFERKLEKQIKKTLFKGKAIIIVGPRQVGKTTLLKKLSKNVNTAFFDCDNPTVRESLNNKDLDYLKGLVEGSKIIAIDEAQKVNTIGQTLKILVDYYGKDKQIIATGSSAFNLLTKTTETLTGRKRVFRLFSLSIKEVFKSKLDYLKNFEQIMRFGFYPESINSNSFNEKIEALTEITSSYLYKDLLEFQDIRNFNVIHDLLRLLAFQIGSEVSYTELAKNLEIDKKTVERYVDLLEKSFVIIRLHPFKNNKRRSIKKHNKIYFLDLGVRNAIINNFNELKFRNDSGELFENLCVIERMKNNEYNRILSNQFFYRTYDGAEVDLIEERDGNNFAYEFKIKEDRKKLNKDWDNFEIINKNKLWEFVK